MIKLDMAQAAYLRMGLGNIKGLCEGIHVHPPCLHTRRPLMLEVTIQ